jgi:hypothetical protein
MGCGGACGPIALAIPTIRSIITRHASMFFILLSFHDFSWDRRLDFSTADSPDCHTS